jgi:[ribosomal protein S5]-alanine N-acetyltransferase
MFPDSLQTARLLLRRPVAADAEAMFAAYAQDPEVTRYLVWLPHRSLEASRQFIAACIERWKSRSAFAWVITTRRGGELAGMIELRPKGSRADFGFVLARAFWGQGLMPEAAAAVIDLALAQPSIWRLETTCDCDNQGSIRVLEKIGMKREARLARYMIHPTISPEPRDSFLYAITK